VSLEESLNPLANGLLSIFSLVICNRQIERAKLVSAAATRKAIIILGSAPGIRAPGADSTNSRRVSNKCVDNFRGNEIKSQEGRRYFIICSRRFHGARVLIACDKHDVWHRDAFDV